MNNISSGNTDNKYVNKTELGSLVIILLLFILFSRSEYLSVSNKQWLTDIAWMVFALLASIRCYQVAQVHTGNLKKAWLFITYAHVSWFVGIVIWGYLELIAKQVTPFPAVSDFGFMLFAPLYFIGLYHFRQDETHDNSKLVDFTKVAVIVACLVVAHTYLLMARLAESNEGWLYITASITYPVLYMAVLIYGLLSFAHLNKQVSLSSYVLLFLAFFVHAVTDSLYAYSLLGRDYQVGHYLDILWLLGFGLVYLAATQSKIKSGIDTNRNQFIFIKSLDTMLVPTLLAVLLVIILSNISELNKQYSDVYIYGLSALLATVVLYQISVARLERILLKNLLGSELLLKKTHSELNQLATESTEKLQEEIRRHKLTDGQLKQNHKMLDIIKRVQDEYISGIDRHEFFDRLLSTILDVTDSEYGFIGEVLQRDGRLYLKTFSITNISWNEATRQFYEQNAPQGLEFTNLNSLFGYAIENREIVISNDPLNDERRGGLPEGHPALNAFAGIPLIVNDNMIGMVGVANREGGYSQDLIEDWGPFFGTCVNLVLANKVENDRKMGEIHLLKAKQEAEIANRTKTEFMSRMSHELRTPLNAVIGFSQLLDLDESLNKDHKESISEIYKAGIHLLGLINDLLDVSRIESNKLTYNFETLSIRKIIEESIQLVDKSARDNNISINFQTGNDYNIKGDEVRIKQIFTNLLTNAIKYNQKDGEINININNDHAGYCAIIVKDTGIGIAEDKLPRLFMPFDRLDVEKYSVEGVGIGLYIIKQIIEMHGGDIFVNSVEGKGSTFEVRIPLSK